jgi:hypothetical protein
MQLLFVNVKDADVRTALHKVIGPALDLPAWQPPPNPPT